MTIKNEQSRETGNIRHKRHRTNAKQNTTLKKMSNTDPTNTREWTQMPAKDKQFLPLIRRQPCYSYSQYMLDTTMRNIGNMTSEFVYRKYNVCWCYQHFHIYLPRQNNASSQFDLKLKCCLFVMQKKNNYGRSVSNDFNNNNSPFLLVFMIQGKYIKIISLG